MIKNLKTSRPVAELRAGRNDWYRIENKSGGSTEADIYIYDEIGYFGVSAADFIRDLQSVKAGSINLHINSPGGEVFDGLAIMEALRSHKATVTTYVDSLAASIASVIAQGGEKVIMARNATMMIHDGHGMAIGNAADMRQLADLLDKTSDNIASVYAAKAGGSVANWRDKMRAETWFSAEEAVTAGLADEINGDPVGSVDGPANSWDLSIYAKAPIPTPVGEVKKVEVPVVAETPVAGTSGSSSSEDFTFEFDPIEFRNAMRRAAE